MYLQVAVDHPVRGSRVGACGPQRMECHQLQVAKTRVLGTHSFGQREVDLACAGRIEQLAHPCKALAEAHQVVRHEVVADQRASSQRPDAAARAV